MNRALEGARRKGRVACRAGAPRTANPYPDHRTWRGAVTFSRAFRTAWRDGWDEAAAHPAIPPHVVRAGEDPCRCSVEPAPGGGVVRAVLDEHTAQACRDADGHLVGGWREP